MAALIAAWRKQAVAIVTNPQSTESQRRLAWRVLSAHGAR